MYIYINFFANSDLTLFNELTSIVSGNVSQCPGSRFLDPGVKLLQTNHQGVQSPTVHHRLGQLWGVLGYCPQDESCCLLVESLKSQLKYFKLKQFRYCGKKRWAFNTTNE